MRLLHLIRHGETGWNAEERLQGRADLALSSRGVAQVEELRSVLAAVLAGVPPYVVCSPLIRTRQTCELLSLRPDVIDERWQEADLGAWTGRTRTDLLASADGRYARWRAGTYDPPGAERVKHLRERVGAALSGLPDHAQVVVLTHGGPIRAACQQLVGLDQGNLMPVRPGSLTSIDLSGPRGRLQHFNLVPVLARTTPAEAPD